MSDYELIRYHPSLKDQVLDLQRYLWGEADGRNADYFRWKYEENPYISAPVIYLACTGDRVVGMRGLFGTRWQAGRPTERMTWLCGADAVVHPDHRGVGLSKTIIEFALADLSNQEYPVVVSVSGNTRMRRGNESLGWRSVGNWRVAWRDGSPGEEASLVQRALVRFGLKTTPEQGGASFQAMDSNSARSHVGRIGKVVLERKPRSREMAALVDRVGQDDRMRQVRDETFFRWRFQNPFSNYRFLYSLGDAGLEGYLVLQIPTNREKVRVNLVDWEAARPEILGELLQTALKWGRFDRLFFWSGVLPDELREVFLKEGFIFQEDLPEAEGQFYCPALQLTATGQDMLEENDMIRRLRLLEWSRWDLRGVFSDNF